MYDLVQFAYLAQQFGTQASDMGMCCLCRLILTANAKSAKHDSVGQNEETARLHSQSGICCTALHLVSCCTASKSVR